MNLIFAFLILGFLIFIHELGHFLVAKLVKAPVYKFAIGIGPRLFYKTINGTEYSIRLLPLGGFVQLELEEELEENKQSEFKKLSITKRACVYSAGAVFNFILAFILILAISFSTGYPTTTVGEVYTGTPAELSGLKSGDTIISIENKEIKSWSDISRHISDSTSENVDSLISFKIKRDAKIQNIKIQPILDEETGSYVVGITPQYKKSFSKSLKSSFISTLHNIKATYNSLIDIFGGLFDKNDNTSASSLSGPLGTIQVISNQTKQGIRSSIAIMISLTISLGVFNLLPIPGLDGGKIFILIIEFLRGGKQMSLKHETDITVMGLLIIFSLILLSTYNDISRLF